MVRKAADLMDPAVLVVDARTTVLTCAKRMVERGQGYAVLTGGKEPVSGIVTEWDVLNQVVAAGRDPAEVLVGEIASAPVVSCVADLPTDRVVELMVSKGVRRLVVTDHDRIVGVVTTRLLLRAFRRYVDEICADIAKNNSIGSTIGA